MRIVFAGTPEFAARGLQSLLDAGHHIALVLTRPDRPAGRGMRASTSAVKRLALARGLNLYQPASLKEPAAVASVAAVGAELLVVAAYGLILPQAMLDIAPLGALNIHASLLPRWRGAAPIQRALLAGDERTGITIMKMDAGLDTGPMLAQRALPITAADDAGTLHDKLAALGAEMVVAAVEQLAAGTVHLVPQPAEGVTYAAKLEKHDSVLDWKRTARELERVVRAFRPAPGATTTLARETLKIWRAEEVAASGAPGELLSADARGLVVACGEGALAISEIQRAGGRRLSAADFLRGRPLARGTRFGEPQPGD